MTLVRHLWSLTPRDDVRVRIESLPEGQLINKKLAGNSGGGALALGLWSVWTETPLNADYVTSFALTAPASNE